MDDGINLHQIESYVNTVIPNIERELADPTKSVEDKHELYILYVDVMRITAPYDFITYNKYLELDEDHNNPQKAFYHHRKEHMSELFDAFNDMEIYDKYDMLLVSLPPRTGKTTTGIRFLSWIGGKYPESTQLGTSYSDNITMSFYNGILEVVESDRHKEVFPTSHVVNQNAKREEIWLRVMKRYPSIVLIPIGGSMTGRGEAEKYLYCDDLVSGIEEALSVPRLDSLWQKYTVNCKQRKKDGAKEIHVATMWSVHDPISKLAEENKDNPRCKIIRIPCYDENRESNFNFKGGFSTKYYNDLESSMDSASFGALYLCDPIERDGLLYTEDSLQWYYELPNEREDTIISICDSKNLGTDYVCSPVGIVYGDLVYVDDAVFNKGLPEVTRPLVANKWIKYGVVRADVEMNNGGNYFAEMLDTLVKQGGGKTSIRMFFTSNNKTTKIITFSDYVKSNFVFRHPSTSDSNEYKEFLKALQRWTQSGKNSHDDAPDGVAMLAQLHQILKGGTIKFIDRRKVRA